MTKTKIARTATPLLAILVVISGAFGALHYAGICTLDVWQDYAANSLGWLLYSLDISQIPVTCPLGFLERSFAIRELLPLWYISVGVVVLSVILLGRVFCAWVCPAGLIRQVFKINARPEPTGKVSARRVNWASYSSYAVLGGVLVASLLFQFPVFCLVCPVGLLFGTLYAVIRLVSPNPFSVELLLFPLLLGLELFALRSWCRSFCPLGALLSIIGNLNHFLVPVVNKNKCRTSKGIQCGACKKACPEGIDLTEKKLFAPNSCTKCLECSNKCPVKAIEIRLFA